MRTVRFLVPLAAAALGLLLLPTVATAEPYPIGSPLLTADRPTVTAGEAVDVFGSGFGAGDTVTVNVVFQAAARPPGDTMVPVAYTAQRRAVVVIADANGDFVVNLLLDQVGLAVISASGLPSGVFASITIRVLGPGANLPVTGQSGTPLRIALIGSAVAAMGVVLLVLVRSRRRRAGTHSG